ncbi:PspC domain-containing protein [Streptomyces zingiberis]|uniref:PspC domain-containing protein n=1 Tax=Streptomyces zingiberis TaxID=2053010 RepID=A0ABX1BSM3_9ACTN|nr:PspC domain-containing protein [Streptomyces zingiberis]NJQ00719.1 PspC domain-containing protein [Streptomyces zingiberis]
MSEQQPTAGPAAGPPGGAPAGPGGAAGGGTATGGTATGGPAPGQSGGAPRPEDGSAPGGGPASTGPASTGPLDGLATVLPRLRRSRQGSVISGVCAGLGRQFALDPVIFRIVLTVLALAGGVGLIGYGFAWLLVPREGEDENEARRLLSGRVEGPGLTALLFALVGSGLLLTMLNNGGLLFFAALLSASLAGVCSWSLQKRRAEREGAAADAAAAQAVADAPPETTAPPAPGGPSWWRDPLTKDGSGDPGGTGYLWGPADAASVPGPRLPWQTGTHRHGRRAGGLWTGGWTFLAAVLAAVAGTLLSARSTTTITAADAQTGFACALAVFGLGLAVAAWYGRTGAGTVIAAVLACVLTVGAGSLPGDTAAEWRTTSWRPTAAADVRPVYGVGAGVAELDLTGLGLREGDTVHTRASVGVGELRVLVPGDTTVELTLEFGLGSSRLPGDPPRQGNVTAGDIHRTLRPPEGRAPSGTLVLELEAGVGRVEVHRAAAP